MLYTTALLTSLASMAITATAHDCTSIKGTIPQPPGQPQVDACANSLKLGDKCGDSRQCPSGVQCYASNSGLVPVCGNFNAECKTDEQCAYNRCNGGLCAGPETTKTSRETSSASSSTCSPIVGTITQPSGQPQVTACANALKLGDVCGDDKQCPKDVECFGSTAGTIRTCGSFNAKCTSDEQCATNTCNNGLCNGIKNNSTTTTASASASSASATAASSTAASSSSAVPAPGYSPGSAPAGPPSNHSSSVSPAHNTTSGHPTNDAGKLIPGGIAVVFGAIIGLL